MKDIKDTEKSVKDITQELNDIECGYVTFADILGWKSVWKNNDLREIVSRLVNIEETITQTVEGIMYNQMLSLIESDLKDFYSTEEAQNEVDLICARNGHYSDLINIGIRKRYYQDKIEDIRDSIFGLSFFQGIIEGVNLSEDTEKYSEAELIKRLKYHMYAFEDTKDIKRLSKTEILEDINVTEDVYSMLRSFGKDLELIEKEQKELENKFYSIYNKKIVKLSISLISDTFVITSVSENKEDEFFYHMMITKEIIKRCLNNKLLIRGATSFGRYYRSGMVFAGPAIDDAASWHELGEEIGIFLTPKAFFATKNKWTQNSVKHNHVFVGKPKLKVNSFETYNINWGDYYCEFQEIIDSSYETILPEISQKIINSLQRGKDLFSEMDIIRNNSD